MSRTIVRINHNYPGPPSFGLTAYSGVTTMQELVFPQSDAFDGLRMVHINPDAVKSAGILLFDMLCTHPDIAQAIRAALKSPQGNAVPIYIHLDSTEAEALPWETLCDKEKEIFLALQEQWPIVRITGNATAPSLIVRAFETPLRVMAILSAIGIDAKPEWEALYSAIVQHTTFPLEIRVFVSEKDLEGSIRKLAENPVDQRITIKVQFIPESQPQLLDEIKYFDPHILHFFCHGEVKSKIPYLELATCTDQKAQKKNGSITIQANELIPLSNKDRHNWLITLNCCQSAAPLEKDCSLALTLVNNGLPMVTGMREALNNADAHVFCSALYCAVMQEVDDQFQEGLVAKGSLREVEWGVRALYEPRIQLCNKYSNGQPQSIAAAGNKQWTLPIIYIRPESFMLHGPSPGTEILDTRQDELSELLRVRKFLKTNPKISQSEHEKLLAEINEEIADLVAQLNSN